MKAHIISSISGAALALASFFGIQHYVPSPKPMIISATTQRPVRGAWNELTQGEVNALTAALKKIEKRPVTLICIREPLCGGLTLDLDNAFESAHWETKLDTLMFGDARGILVSDADMTDVINKSTSLSAVFDTSQLEAEQRLAQVAGADAPVGIRIVIGRKSP